MKAYLYTIAILHDTVLCLTCQQGVIYHSGQKAAPRTAMYLRRIERQTRVIRDTVVQDAIDFFGREKIRRALAEEAIQLMHMDEEDMTRLTNSMRGLFSL